jgi:hypothetical protein
MVGFQGFPGGHVGYVRIKLVFVTLAVFPAAMSGLGGLAFLVKSTVPAGRSANDETRRPRNRLIVPTTAKLLSNIDRVALALSKHKNGKRP